MTPRAASSWPARSWTTRCRAPATCRTSRSSFNEVPCTTNVLGIKGAGEAGSVGSLAAVMNAVLDALAPLGVRRLDMPASPQRVWAAIAQAGAVRPGAP